MATLPGPTLVVTNYFADTLSRLAVRLDYLKEYWFIPLCMAILWLYGRYHFNTPTYKLSLNVHETASYSDESHLISQLPPIATTRANYFRTFATRYAATLLIVFLAMTTMYPLAKFGLHLIHWAELPDATSVKDSAIISLLIILGLVPSVPFGKKVDTGLLGYFHKKAFIPSEAGVLAKQIIGSEYHAKDDTVSYVKSDLKKRDTRRVAEGPWRGELEEKIVKLRCLDKEISDKLSGGKYSGAVVLLEQDFDRIKAKKTLLIEEINHFLDLQEVLLQDEMTDIDEYLKRKYPGPHRDYLIAQRDVPIKKIQYLYELICFVLSVTLIVTDKVSRRINDSLRQLGFDVVVAEPPPVAVDTIVKVAASVFVVQTAFYFVLTLLGVSYGQFSETTTFEISALKFLAYLFAMAAATATMKGAYHWRIRADMRLI